MPLNSMRYIPEHGARYNDMSESSRLEVHRSKLRDPLIAIVAMAVDDENPVIRRL
jgi:hypothetical protein